MTDKVPSPDLRTHRAPGVKDVAAHAGVSIGTVSHVLNHPHRVSPALCERVLAAIAELRYVPNTAARQLRIGTTSNASIDRPPVADEATPDTRSKA